MSTIAATPRGEGLLERYFGFAALVPLLQQHVSWSGGHLAQRGKE